ncbi:MAG: hypothetical protein JO316_12575 [Abitibacteriaceae bacterium]|nr:hypothetical protein [Abditibacteriaceae bacterium]
MSRYLILFCCCLYFASLTTAATPLLRVVRSAQTGVALLPNGGFEAMDNPVPMQWQRWQKGFTVVPGQGRNGSNAIMCENLTGEGEYGANQTLDLQRNVATPLVIRGWSKAQDVNGSADSNYSIYVDITYSDNTPLWGQTADFTTGTHDWQQREVMIVPAKPVKSLTVYCLFRSHSGKVWFDDVTVEEIKANQGAVLFQGVPVTSAPQSPASGKSLTVATRDALSLSLRDNSITQLQVEGHNVKANTPSGFLARDVAANSDFYNFQNGVCPDLGLKLQSRVTAATDHIAVEGRVSDVRGQDRAVTLVFALPLDATGWRWGDDIRHSRVIEGNTEYSNTVAVHCGATGTMSLYPLAAVWHQQAGLALAIDMGQIAQYRVAYNAGTKQLFIAYDFGLVKETSHFPSSADFRFVIYKFDPRWGFRAALRKMHDIFPSYFQVRSPHQGLWMPFTDISTVQDWQDFGFRYHEGDNNVPFDDAHDILSFRYTEPMTWWMPMEKGVPRTVEAASKVRDDMVQRRSDINRRMAQASLSANMFDEAGQPAMRFIDAPWNSGAVWSLNPNPSLPPAPGLPDGLNGATVHWNPQIKQRLYGPEAKGNLDGEYLDSIEGYVTADLNFRREHFRYSTVPLTFATESKQPALYKAFAVCEFTKWLAADVHGMGKLMFANGLPYRFPFLCPWLDVMGTETDWLNGGKYQPVPDEQLDLWRTAAYAKPYLLLMNTNFDAFGPEVMEKYFQRSLFYGMYPSMFSHNAADNPYWSNPKWYNRDRSLFKKYVPLIKWIAEAGWQPVTDAMVDNPHIAIERFGPSANGSLYFTLRNDTTQRQSGEVMIDNSLSKYITDASTQELISGHLIERAGNRFSVVLEPEEVQAVHISR